MPSRFTELLVLSLIVLAGYRLAKACARFGTRGKAWLAAVVLVAALLGTPGPEDARRDAARLAAFFDVRYVVIHGEYLDAGTFERLDHFVADNFPHASRRVDGTVVTYGLRRPDPSLWPERYVIDFGDERREFVLLTGWWSNERWTRAARPCSGRTTVSPH